MFGFLPLPSPGPLPLRYTVDLPAIPNLPPNSLDSGPFRVLWESPECPTASTEWWDVRAHFCKEIGCMILY